MVAIRKPEGWTEVNEFDWSGRKLCAQANNLLALQVQKGLHNLAVHERQCDYKIAVLDEKIRQIRERHTSPRGNNNTSKEELPIKNS